MIFNDKEYANTKSNLLRYEIVLKWLKQPNPDDPIVIADDIKAKLDWTTEQIVALHKEIDAYELNLPAPCFIYARK